MKKLLIFLLSAGLINFSTHAFWSVRPRDTEKNVHARSSEVKQQVRRTPAQTSQKQMVKQEGNGPKRFITEVNFRYFKPSSCVLREIYGKNWIDYQVKVSGSLMPRNDFWNRLHVWFAINYAGKSGKSVNGLEQTRIQLVPISFGLRFIKSMCTADNNVEFYLGTGLKYYFMDINNKSLFVEPCVNRSRIGGVGEAGVYFLAGENVAFNFMLDYSFIRFGCPKKSCIDNVQRFNLKASGLAIGGGVGFRF